MNIVKYGFNNLVDFNNLNNKKLGEWSEPKKFDEINVPDFPIDYLPKVLKEYAEAVSEALQTPIDMAAVASLAVISTCVQGKYKVQGKPDWIEPLNLYISIIADPGERKSPTLKYMTQFIENYECEQESKMKPEIDRNRLEKDVLSEVINLLKKKVMKNPSLKCELLEKQEQLSNFKELAPPRLFADDITPEALISLLVSNDGKISLCSAEGGIFDIMSGRYSKNINIDVYLKAYSGDPIRVDRKGRPPEYIYAPALTMLLFVQPTILEGLLSNSTFTGRGLTARFLYSIPKSIIGQRRFDTIPIPEGVASQYNKLCKTLLEYKVQEPNILLLSEEACALLKSESEKLESQIKGKYESISEWAAKLIGQMLRIAGILHIVINGEKAMEKQISKETMNSAREIANYFLQHAQYCFDLMGLDKQVSCAKYILNQLKKQDKKILSKYDLFRACRSKTFKFEKVDDITQSLELLIQYGYVREVFEEDESTMGRKKDNRYELNPLFFI